MLGLADVNAPLLAQAAGSSLSANPYRWRLEVFE
jgi:hypothetical protein